MTDQVLALDRLSVRFPGSEPAVDGLSLTVAAGEVLSLIGESGSGKSTALNAIAGLLPPEARVSGHMRLAGRDGDLLAPGADRTGVAGRRIAMIFQNPGASLNPVLPVGAQLDEVVRAHRAVSRAEARAVTEGLLDSVGMPRAGPQARDWARAYPHQLSGGQRQRVAIAAALVGDPCLLLSDESTTALDSTVQAQILDLLLRLADERGITIIFVTHDLALAASIGDRIVVLRDGAVQEEGEARQITNSPGAAYTADLVAASLPFRKEARAEHGRMPAASETGALVLEDVHRGFAARGGGRVRAVGGVSLKVGPGEIVGLIGESGSGKTTLGRIAAGLERADRGGARIGEDRLDFGRDRHLVQMVFQDPLACFNPRQTIARALAHPLRCLRGLKGGALRRASEGLLEGVGLDPALGSRRPHQLSGGQLQRAAIARALAAGPRFLVCDEAVASLDVSVRAQVLELLDRLRERDRLGILFISHDLGVVQRIADRTAVMRHGILVEAGPTAALLSAPKQPYTRELLASVPSGERPWRAARAAGPRP